MSQEYFAILTAIGEAKDAGAKAGGAPLKFTHMVVGDGGGAATRPDARQTKLVREVWRAQLNQLSLDPINTSQVIAECVIAEKIGGWWIREIGLLDADGDLVAVANCPPSYKPQMPEGSARTQVIRMVLIVSSAETVQLSIDPGIVMATRQFAADAVAQKFDALGAVGGDAMVGVMERSTGDALRLTDAMARMPSRFGRIDVSSFPRLFDAIRRYRYGDPTQKPIVACIFASSLGNAPTLPSIEQAPGHDFFARLRAEIDPAGLIQFEIRNYSLDGSTVSSWEAAIAGMLAAGVSPHIAYLVPGMNDFATAQYNGGQGFQGFQRSFARVLYALKKIGSDIVATTSMHPAVVSNPGLQSLPGDMAQVYPTAIAAPVSAAALQPPADEGLMQVDVLKNGHPITVSKRYYFGNMAIKCIAATFGVPVIDAQQYQFEQYAQQLLALGSMTAVEKANFNPGQVNHPNLTGIRGAYHRANADACAQLGQQGAQAGRAPMLNGNFGVNLPQGVGVQIGPGLPGATWDIYPQHGDTTTPPVSVKANTGALDSYGVKSPVEAWHIDPANGNLVSPACIIGSAVGMPAFRATDYTGRAEVRDRLRFYNLPKGSTAAAYTLPEGMSGSFTLAAFQPGVTTAQRYRIEFIAHKGVITLEPGFPLQLSPDTEFSVAINGLTITATTKIDGTAIHLACDAW
ncbi:phage tail protein [Janthinobacterium sp.]|uniref:phage tail protein n=1 Tax=Janthinobacterium sp. TaxID=1871054 RepID=UPI00260B6B39|nr:phage tail protein [Janthinobacterium sp.]